jgi:hypothetical protein
MWNAQIEVEAAKLHAREGRSLKHEPRGIYGREAPCSPLRSLPAEERRCQESPGRFSYGRDPEALISRIDPACSSAPPATWSPPSHEIASEGCAAALPSCYGTDVKRAGFARGLQRYRCNDCERSFGGPWNPGPGSRREISVALLPLWSFELSKHGPITR